MGKLLLICNLECNCLQLIEKSLNGIEKPEEIILHYAYQIPENSTDVIKTHDLIKEQAKAHFSLEAKKIAEKTGIKTNIKLSLGLLKTSLKRLLVTNKFSFIIGSNFDKLFTNQFPNVNFINIKELI